MMAPLIRYVASAVKQSKVKYILSSSERDSQLTSELYPTEGPLAPVEYNVRADAPTA